MLSIRTALLILTASFAVSAVPVVHPCPDICIETPNGLVCGCAATSLTVSSRNAIQDQKLSEQIISPFHCLPRRIKVLFCNLTQVVSVAPVNLGELLLISGSQTIVAAIRSCGIFMWICLL